MRAYIERPISENPEKDGKYVVWDKAGEFRQAVYEDGHWWNTPKHTHWLQPVEIPDTSPVVNTDVLAALKYVINCGDSCEKCIKVCEEALSQFTGPQPDNKEEKK